MKESTSLSRTQQNRPSEVLSNGLAHHDDPFAALMRDDAFALMERVRDFRRARAARRRVECELRAERAR